MDIIITMEKFQLLREEALDNFKKADHMLTVTYPMIGDTRILLNVADNIFLSLTKAMSSVVYHDRLFKYVPSFNDNFEGKFLVFKDKCMRKHKIDLEYAKIIQEVKEIVMLHKQSPVEFKRKDRFVICTENYRMIAITVNMLKDYLKKTKEFISIVQLITRKNEGIFS